MIRRITREYRQHYLGGGSAHPDNYDELTHSYSFAGELLETVRRHMGTGSPALKLTLSQEYTYDHRGRPLDSWHTVNTGARTLLARLAYNQIGQLRQKQLHSTNSGSTFAGSIAYSYNERGWLTKTASPHFTQELKYNLPTAGAAAQYNGNIAEQHWGHGITTPNLFVYSYDPLDRLLSGISTSGGMSEVLSYDDMGNITSLTRDGGTPIAYTYSGNRLTTLSGGVTGSYTYDANGNAITDRNALNYTYNHLNLPVTATKTGTSVTYTYDALGTRLRSQGALAPAQLQDYVQGIEYTGGILERIHTQEGYLLMDGPSPVYHYYLHDHLGNVRSVLTPSGSAFAVVQQKDYYPYGLRKALAGAGENPYLYNGKELQGELGGQYDYGARMLDPVIGRWNVPDPLAEYGYEWSPYNYAFNNPTLYTDPDGMWPELSKLWKSLTDWIGGGSDTGQQLLPQAAEGEEEVAYSVELMSVSITGDGPKRPAVSGFMGNLEHFIRGGNYDGYRYDMQGNVLGTSFIMGTAPTPGMKKFDLTKITNLGKTLRSLTRKGNMPKEVARIDIPKLDPSGNTLHGQQIHIHLKDGRALNIDGTWKHGSGEVPKGVLKWIDDVAKNIILE